MNRTDKIINYVNLKLAEQILVDSVDIPTYFIDYVVKEFYKYQGTGVNIDLDKGPVLCPFHNEADPSFHYVKKGKYYNCFSCNAGGDRHSGGNIVHLHKEIRKQLTRQDFSIVRAIQELAEMYDINIPDLFLEVGEGKSSNLVSAIEDMFKQSKEREVIVSVISDKFGYDDFRKFFLRGNNKQKLLLCNIMALQGEEVLISKKEVLELFSSFE